MRKNKTVFARYLRNNMTDAERKLWSELRGDQLGVRFRRQVPPGSYIVDFLCFNPPIVIEIDGGHHGEDPVLIYDEQRTKWLQSRRYNVLRFWNDEVLTEIDHVVEEIMRTLALHPNLPPKEEGISGRTKNA